MKTMDEETRQRMSLHCTIKDHADMAKQGVLTCPKCGGSTDEITIPIFCYEGELVFNGRKVYSAKTK